jgi:hypothetical protein
MQAGYPEVVSSEIPIQGADVVRLNRRPYGRARKRECTDSPAESQTPGMHRNFTRENRETPSLSAAVGSGPLGESDEL